jgi:hypothetical protein
MPLLRDHLLVQNADDQNFVGHNPVKHDMFSVLEPAQPTAH